MLGPERAIEGGELVLEFPMEIHGTIVVFDSRASGAERVSIALRNAFNRHFVVELSECQAAISRILALRPVLIVVHGNRDGLRSTTLAWAAGTDVIAEVTRFLPGTRWVFLMPDSGRCPLCEDVPAQSLTVVSDTAARGNDFVAVIRHLIECAGYSGGDACGVSSSKIDLEYRAASNSVNLAQATFVGG